MDMAQIIIDTLAMITWLTLMWLLISGIRLLRIVAVAYRRYLLITAQDAAQAVRLPGWPGPGKGTA